MKRNLSRRVEVAFPVYDKEIQKQLQKMIDLQWKDNQKARIIDQKQTNGYKIATEEKKIRSQYEIYKLMR
jgi:polyphosphate kinase